MRNSFSHHNYIVNSDCFTLNESQLEIYYNHDHTPSEFGKLSERFHEKTSFVPPYPIILFNITDKSTINNFHETNLLTLCRYFMAFTLVGGYVERYGFQLVPFEEYEEEGKHKNGKFIITKRSESKEILSEINNKKKLHPINGPLNITNKDY
ncbi:hypothetical protein ACTFIY_008073 [Dictyostelium cf. discoideum]